MLAKNIIALILFAVGIAWCQTPPGFIPPASEKLGVEFGRKVAAHNGNKLQKDDTQHIPRLDIKFMVDDWQQGITQSSHYIVFMIDLDVPKNDTTVPFLHWYQPDLSLNVKTGKLSPRKSSHRDRAEYYGPAPPPGPEHRYVEVLFLQPPHYEIPDEFRKYLAKESSARIGFDINQFVKAAGLKKPIAGNWFLVQNTGAGEENEEL